MAITFLQKKKIRRFLIPVLGAVVFITAAVIWWGFFTTNVAPKDGTLLPPPRRVEVDTSILLHPLLLELDEPRAKTQIPPKVGRDNPLLPSFQ
ncbi:hypothetical protein IIB97_00150 [Patescibacteria group bacterium]|nr:hypothetical protein [Patescibacteria group bacterium]